MIGLVAVALLLSACGGEQGFDQEGEEDYGVEEEQVVGEEMVGEEVRVDAESLGIDIEDLDASPGAKGGPPRRVLEGKRSIVCAGIKWQNREKPAATEAACNSLSRRLADFYRDNSRGLLTLVPVAGHPVAVPYDGNNAHLAAAEKMVKNTFNADFYVIPSIFTHPHAGGKVAHVKSAQLMTAAHEVGHLLGLGHAGRYTYGANGKTELNAYGDTKSIMGRVFSNFLSPPQYYYLGWLPDDEVAMYDPMVDSYLVKQISDFKGSGLATVMVPPAGQGGRWAFIGALRCPKSPSKTCVTLHLANGGGSQKVAESSNEIYDERFTGLHIKVLEVSEQRARISIDYEPKP
ncbi:Hypothetical protein A7982_06144 [Minicystis rosea]|nr:Hypothetical protein A7982_06144 [Minicystis rosea]